MIEETEVGQKGFGLDLTERVVAQGALADLELSAARDEVVSALDVAMVVRARVNGVIVDRAMTSAHQGVSVVATIPLRRRKAEREEVEESQVVSVAAKASVDHVVLRTIKD